MNLIREIDTSVHTAGGADSELARDSLTCRIANWCPFERCSTILHCGRLYLKPSAADQFRYVRVYIGDALSVSHYTHLSGSPFASWSLAIS